jgi:hypothetical protein
MKSTALFLLILTINVACDDEPESPIGGTRCDTLNPNTIGAVCNNGSVTYELNSACGSRSQGGVQYYLCKTN